MGAAASTLPAENHSALLSDATLQALRNLSEDAQREILALAEIREIGQPRTAAVETPEAACEALKAALERREGPEVIEELAVSYARCYQAYLLRTPGALPPAGTYSNEESIFELLRPIDEGCLTPVKLLTTAWVKARAAKLKAATTDDERRKLALPRRQDLERDEPEAFMSVERLKELPVGTKAGGYKLAAAASSYCWLTPAQPDPLGEQLVALAEAIEKAETQGSRPFPSEAAIFVDFASLHQKDPNLWHPCCSGPTYKPPEERTAEEAAAADAYQASRSSDENAVFNEALPTMNIWYAHTKLTAFLSRTLPEGYESVTGYEDRGWPTCEELFVALATASTMFCWSPIFDVGASEPYRRRAPLTPTAMARLLAHKRFTSRNADLPMVIALTTRTILSVFRDATELKYLELGWGDDEVMQLVEVLPLCSSVRMLNLSSLGGNKISARGVRALVKAFSDGELPMLEKLYLLENGIGDDGAKALAGAIGKGALPNLQDLRLRSNQIGDDGAMALAEAIGKGALPKLERLLLFGNNLSEAGREQCEAVVKEKRSGLEVKI